MSENNAVKLPEVIVFAGPKEKMSIFIGKISTGTMKRFQI